MTFLKILAALAVAYAAVVAVLYAVQDRLLFPADMAVMSGTPVPPDAPRLELTTTGGETLHGVRLAPPAAPVNDRLIVLAFGGNAWNAEDAAVYLFNLYPQAEVVAFHYRGYAPSTGRASVDALIADAPLIYDKVREDAEKLGGNPRIIAAGFSIGSGVAVHLARERKLDGLVLVTPFDSLAEVAQVHFPWVPAARLLKNPMRNGDLLKGLDIPTAIIAAEHDEIIPRERSSMMRGAAKRMVYSRTIKGVGHNDIYENQDFANAMREALSAVEGAWQAEP
ncbi:MAG: alpha/beta hydrolase [Rhodospirillaceae bacterium]